MFPKRQFVIVRFKDSITNVRQTREARTRISMDIEGSLKRRWKEKAARWFTRQGQLIIFFLLLFALCLNWVRFAARENQQPVRSEREKKFWRQLNGFDVESIQLEIENWFGLSRLRVEKASSNVFPPIVIQSDNYFRGTTRTCNLGASMKIFLHCPSNGRLIEN